MKLNAISLSLDFLAKLGYYALNVEHRPRIPVRADLLITRDLFGFADIVALKDHVLLVQTTSLSNIAARAKKIQCSEAFEHCKRAGMRIHVHGWSARTGLKIVDMTNEATDLGRRFSRTEDAQTKAIRTLNHARGSRAMNPVKWFAVALIVLDLGAAAGYGYDADWRRCV